MKIAELEMNLGNMMKFDNMTAFGLRAFTIFHPL